MLKNVKTFNYFLVCVKAGVCAPQCVCWLSPSY